MRQKILYPFFKEQDNRTSYTKTLQFAKKIDAEVICFSTTEQEEDIDQIYHSLLGLNGYFQTVINHWENSEVKIQNAIQIGNFEKKLTDFLASNQIDIVICSTHLKKLKTSFIDKLLLDKEIQPSLISL